MLKITRKLHMKYAAIAGLLWLIFYTPILVLDFIDSLQLINIFLLTIMIALSFVSYLIFMRAFIILGGNYENKLLTVTSYFLIMFTLFEAFIMMIDHQYNILGKFSDSMIWAVIVLIALGLIALLHGLSLLRLENNLGEIAKITGLFETLLGIGLITIILSPIALLLILPVHILEIMLLFKASKTPFAIKKNSPSHP